MINRWEFYRLIEDRVYGLVPDDNEFMNKLVELGVPPEICKWLVDNIA